MKGGTRESTGHSGTLKMRAGWRGPPQRVPAFSAFRPATSIPSYPTPPFSSPPTALPGASLRIAGTGCSVKTGPALHSWHPQWPGQLREGGAAVEIGAAARQAWGLEGSSHL